MIFCITSISHWNIVCETCVAMCPGFGFGSIQMLFEVTLLVTGLQSPESKKINDY